jgi:hypothetical protein
MTRQPKTMGWPRTRGAMTSRVHRATSASERSLRPDCAKAWPSCCAAVAWDGQAVDLKAAGCQSAGWRWAAAARPSLTERRSRSDGRTAQDRTWFGPRSSAWAVLGRVDASGCCSRRHHLTSGSGFIGLDSVAPEAMTRGSPETSRTTSYGASLSPRPRLGRQSGLPAGHLVVHGA